MILGKSHNISDSIRNGNGLSANSSHSSAMQAHFFIKLRNYYKEAKPYQPTFNGVFANAEVPPQEGTSQFYCGWITSEKQMSDDDCNEDLLSNLLDTVDGDYQDALDTAIHSVNDDN
jgi:hypothetical protein